MTAGKLSNTVYQLKRRGRDVLNESIVVSAGSHLTIVAPESHFTQETAPPQKAFGYYLPILTTSYGRQAMANIIL